MEECLIRSREELCIISSTMLGKEAKKGNKGKELNKREEALPSAASVANATAVATHGKALIGHSEEVISMIVGSVLGDSHLEKRKRGRGTRLKLEQCGKNVEYMMWFHKYLAERGYCRKEKPKLKRRVRKGGVFFHYQINSYTFESLNWLYELFYREEEGKMRKVVFKGIEKYLTPFALAIWFQEDGSRIRETVRIATNNFKEEEVRYLCEVLEDKYRIKASVVKGGKGKGLVLYIYKRDKGKFEKLVKPYMRKTMYYKLGSKEE